MDKQVLPLERLEAHLSNLEGKQVVVRFLIGGTIELAVNGMISMTLDPVTDNPFFRVVNSHPGCSVCFTVKDVAGIVDAPVVPRTTVIFLNNPLTSRLVMGPTDTNDDEANIS